MRGILKKSTQKQQHECTSLLTRRSHLPSFNHDSLLDRLFEASFPAIREPAGFGAFPVDVYEDKETVTVRAELPGFRKEDLQVTSRTMS